MFKILKHQTMILLVGFILFGLAGLTAWYNANQFTPEPIPPEVLSPTTVPDTSTTTTSEPVQYGTDPNRQTTTSTTSTVLAVQYGRPSHLLIEKIGVDDPLVPIGLGPDNEFEAEPFTIAWYQGSVWPGQPGPMLIGAHVAWKQYGADRFAHLSELRPGDKLSLDNELGQAFRYVVTDVYQVDKEDEFSSFINDMVYVTSYEHVLWLLTCGGELQSNGHFADNLFVRAVLTPEEG